MRRNWEEDKINMYAIYTARSLILNLCQYFYGERNKCEKCVYLSDFILHERNFEPSRSHDIAEKDVCISHLKNKIIAKFKKAEVLDHSSIDTETEKLVLSYFTLNWIPSWYS